MSAVPPLFLQQLSEVLKESVCGVNERMKNAQMQMKQAETQPPFGMALLQIASSVDAEPHLRHVAALTFKNFVKGTWDNPAEGPGGIKYRLSSGPVAISLLLPPFRAHDRALIKQHLVSLMLSSPLQIQTALSGAVSSIAASDFPRDWDRLLPELGCKVLEGGLGEEQLKVKLGALQTLNSVLEKYRNVSRSDHVLQELLSILTCEVPAPGLKRADGAEGGPVFPDAHLALYTQLCEGLVGGGFAGQDCRIQEKAAELLELTLSIFISLHAVDLPEHYEENIQSWFSGFAGILKWNPTHLKTKDDETAGCVERVKALVCDCCSIYADKYQSEISPFIQELVSTVWGFLVALDQTNKNDPLITAGIRFLSSAAKIKWENNPFGEEAALKQIAEHVVLPNIRLRESDVETFEDNPREWIRQDLEAADAHTRRRAAVEMVKALAKLQEEKITSLFMGYVENALKSNPSWQEKDACIYIVLAVACKGHTRSLGATSVSSGINLPGFCQSFILPELESCPSDLSRQVLKASAIKFLVNFRTQLPTQMMVKAVPLLCKHLLSPSEVVHTYSSHCLVLLLGMKDGQTGNPLPLGQEEERAILSVVEPCLQRASRLVSSPVEQPNEYTMQLLARIFSTRGKAVVPLGAPSLSILAQLIGAVSANPQSPYFNHYLFEAASALTVLMCSAGQASKAESVLLPVLSSVLEQQVADFIPYCFQVLAIMLDSLNEVKPLYEQLFRACLEETFWRAPSNVQGLVRLFSAYLSKHQIIGESLLRPNLQTLLGRAQYCLGHRRCGQQGFKLLQAMFHRCPLSLYSEYLSPLVILLLRTAGQAKEQPHKHPTFKRDMCLTLCVFQWARGKERKGETKTLWEAIERAQAGSSFQVVQKLVSPGMDGIQSKEERKLCCLGLASMASDPFLMSLGTEPERKATLMALLKALKVGLGRKKREEANRRAVSEGLRSATEEKENQNASLFGHGITLLGDGEDAVEFEVSFAKLKNTELPGAADFAPDIPDYFSAVKSLLSELRGFIGSEGELQPLAQFLAN